MPGAMCPTDELTGSVVYAISCLAEGSVQVPFLQNGQVALWM
jgi:hypothetical protein